MGDRNHRQIRNELLSIQHELSRHLTRAADCGEGKLASLDGAALTSVGRAIMAVNDWIAAQRDDQLDVSPTGEDT